MHIVLSASKTTRNARKNNEVRFSGNSKQSGCNINKKFKLQNQVKKCVFKMRAEILEQLFCKNRDRTFEGINVSNVISQSANKKGRQSGRRVH